MLFLDAAARSLQRSCPSPFYPSFPKLREGIIPVASAKMTATGTDFALSCDTGPTKMQYRTVAKGVLRPSFCPSTGLAPGARMGALPTIASLANLPARVSCLRRSPSHIPFWTRNRPLTKRPPWIFLAQSWRTLGRRRLSHSTISLASSLFRSSDCSASPGNKLRLPTSIAATAVKLLGIDSSIN